MHNVRIVAKASIGVNEHADTLWSMNNLASSYSKLGPNERGWPQLKEN